LVRNPQRTHTAIDKLKEKIGKIDDDGTNDKVQLKEKYALCLADLQESKKNATELRIEHLKKQIKELEASTDPSIKKKVRIMQRILAAETIQGKWNAIQAQMSTKIQSSLSHLELPETNAGEIAWTTVYDPVLIQQAIIERNKGHFQQAQATPFGNGMLAQLLGFEGLSQAADDIVTGTFVKQHGDILAANIVEVRELAVSMAMPAEIQSCGPINTEITKEDFTRGMKKW
jgi:hypothetical protein